MPGLPGLLAWTYDNLYSLRKIDLFSLRIPRLAGLAGL